MRSHNNILMRHLLSPALALSLSFSQHTEITKVDITFDIFALAIFPCFHSDCSIAFELKALRLLFQSIQWYNGEVLFIEQKLWYRCSWNIGFNVAFIKAIKNVADSIIASEHHNHQVLLGAYSLKMVQIHQHFWFRTQIFILFDGNEHREKHSLLNLDLNQIHRFGIETPETAIPLLYQVKEFRYRSLFKLKI